MCVCAHAHACVCVWFLVIIFVLNLHFIFLILCEHLMNTSSEDEECCPVYFDFEEHHRPLYFEGNIIHLGMFLFAVSDF